MYFLYLSYHFLLHFKVVSKNCLGKHFLKIALKNNFYMKKHKNTIKFMFIFF